MAEGSKRSVEAGLRTLFEAGAAVGRSDAELLDVFLEAGGPAAEAAFAAIVERHGPMVWRVCRDVLRESNDADDAFQATFLILARRAREIRKRSALESWLYGTALRVARCARNGAARRRKRDEAAAVREPKPTGVDVDRSDEAIVVHEEVGRLPEKLRSPLLLCYFEGLTHEQAASRLGWPVGTVRSRMAEARDRLRPRLLKRGVGPSAAILAAAGRAQAAAVVPPALASATVQMAIGATAAGTVPAAVAALVEEASWETTVMKLAKLALGLVAAALVGTAGLKYTAMAERPQDAAEAAQPPRGEPITVAVVESKPVTIAERYVGRIESHHHIEVRAPQSGYLEAIPIKAGQTVKQGDLLFQLGSVENGGRPDAAKGSKAVSILALFDGMIGDLPRQQGSFVREGETLASLFDNSRVRVAFNVPEARYLQEMRETAEAKEARKIELLLSGDRKFPQPGKLVSQDARFNAETGTIPFYAEFSNPDRLLRDGQSGVVSISWVETDAITIPQRATRETRNSRYVYVVDKDGVTHRREIDVRAEVDELFVVQKGLEAGERIVVDGVRQVVDGKKVER
ncbi:efflux RND transporter periplasmic adaptor subunit [Paludisphaera rhizosphaerae]|uniref:efflux RND transporter periplasmic adaptor subunit n=1 Tax=Paludisphaera rhizosphaerae TaxID=2711216 RepID=UPI0013ED5959|nr:efflux RND transporter periplasmic adaptor subunit [Paludisphaera rhizosphaerae]